MKRAPLIVLAAVLIAGCGGYETSDSNDNSDDIEAASKEARAAFADAQNQGRDLSAGPCLLETLKDPGLGDWVVDVAHDPRNSADDDPANQCKRAVDGEATHFVELDTQGNVIRVQ